MVVSLHVQYVGNIGLPQYKIVVHVSLPWPVCRSHRSRSLGFFPTYATDIPKYLVWLHAWSSISCAGATGACLSSEACCPGQGTRLLFVLHYGKSHRQLNV